MLVNDDWFARDEARLRVTFVTSNALVRSLQRKMRSCVVVKHRRRPALRIVTIRARRFSGLRKLADMRVFVTILTNLRSAFELHRFCARGDLVTIAALYGPVRAEQREFRLGMVKACDVGPRPRVVAGFAT